MGLEEGCRRFEGGWASVWRTKGAGHQGWGCHVPHTEEGGRCPPLPTTTPQVRFRLGIGEGWWERRTASASGRDIGWAGLVQEEGWSTDRDYSQIRQVLSFVSIRNAPNLEKWKGNVQFLPKNQFRVAIVSDEGSVRG